MAGYNEQKKRPLHGNKPGMVHEKNPSPAPEPNLTPQEQQNQLRNIQTGRGSVLPPTVAASRTLPPDVTSATASPVATASARPQSIDAARQDQKQTLAQERASAEELARRANPDYDPERARELEQKHGGSGAGVHQKDATTLLLNSIGYTGDNMHDFNATVERVNKVFIDVYGHPPTPGLVMDLVRSPEAQDPNALKNLFTGVPQDTHFIGATASVVAAHGAGSALTPEFRAQFGEQKGLEAALRASLFSGNSMPLLTAANVVVNGRAQRKKDADQFSAVASGDLNARLEMAGMMPMPGPVLDAYTSVEQHLKQYGFTPQQFAGKGWQQNQRVADDLMASQTSGDTNSSRARERAIGGTKVSVHNSFAVIGAWQKDMNRKYHLGLAATGVLDDDWAKAIITLSHATGYQHQILAQTASNAGFGESFDSFKAFDANGQPTNTADGRKAIDAIQQFINAQKSQSDFMGNHPLWQTFAANIPLQWFQNGGISVSHGTEWIFSGNQGSFNPLNSPLDATANVANVGEHALIRSGISGFGAANGLMQQSKTDLYASEAFASPLNPTQGDVNPVLAWREAAKRLAMQDNTWLNIAGVSKDWTKNHEEVNMVTNFIGDMVVFRKFGSAGETLDAEDLGRAMRAAQHENDLTTAATLTSRSDYASQRIGQIMKWMKQGRTGKAVEAGDSNLGAGNAMTRRMWVEDTGGEFHGPGKTHQFDGYKPLSKQEMIHPPGPGEELPPPRQLGPGPKPESVKTPEPAQEPVITEAKGSEVVAPESPVTPTATMAAPNPLADLFEGSTRQIMKAQDNAEAAGSKVTMAEEVPEPEHALSWEDLVQKGISEDAHNNIASWYSVTGGHGDQWLFDTWRSPGVPARSTKLVGRMQKFGLKGRAPIPTFHPITAGRAKLWELTSSGMDTADKGFEASDVPGTGYLYHVSRTLRTQFTKVANWRQLPIQSMDPSNVRRLAMDAGLGARTGKEVTLGEESRNLLSAEKYEQMFIEGRANGDTSQINKVRDDLGFAYLAQGRKGEAAGVKNLFGAVLRRNLERDHFDIPLDEITQPGGPLEKQAWSAISAKNDKYTERANIARHEQLKQELKDRGLHFFEQHGKYDGEEERSLFVPGMTMQEALEVGQKFDQQSVLTHKGILWTREGEGLGHYSPFVHKSVDWEWNGKGERPTRFTQLEDDAPDNRSITDFPQGKVAWSTDIAWDTQRPVTREFMTTRGVGQATAQTQHDQLLELIAGAKSDQERELYTKMLENAKTAPSPAIPEEDLKDFGVGEAALPRQRESTVGGILETVNNGAQKLGALNRRAVLATDPILLEKHGLTDTLRRIIASQGDSGFARGVFRVFFSKAGHKDLTDALEHNPELSGLYDSEHNLAKLGEQRYNLAKAKVKGPSIPKVFMTGNAPDAYLDEAAAYLDRRLMSGAYQAWKVNGREGVRKWFLEDPKGIKLAENEGFHGDESHVLADMAADNLYSIHITDPNALDELESVRNAAKFGENRKALKKYLQENHLDIPVTGHVPAPSVQSIVDKLDEGSQWLIGKYMTANKWNRGGLFRDISARTFKAMKKQGADDESALYASIGVAKTVSRYHMFDLADALKVEQQFRWASLFFTKHRLYWTWVLQTIRQHPELAAGVNDLSQMVDAHSEKYPNRTPGTLSFYLPFAIPGTKPAGGKTLFSVPFARLLWLTESQGNPGMLSNIIHSQLNGQSIFPGRGNVEFTTLDSQVNMLGIMLAREIGKGPKTSDGIMNDLNDQDKIRFSQIYARVQGSYFAEHHRYMDDNEASDVTMRHMTITGAWRSFAFTGSYPEDQRLTSKQDAAWKAYNENPDPKARELIRQKNPFIDSMLGVYSSTPRQHTMSQQMWTRYTALRAEHEQRQDALLADAKSNPERVGADLFGKKWQAEGARYTGAINQLESTAKKIGATDWLGQFKSDHFAQVHKAFAAQLHTMYGIPEKQGLKIAEGGRPPWVNTYRAMLYGPNAPLSKEAIAKLPPEQQQPAAETATTFKQMLAPYFSHETSTPVEDLRNKYFDTAYTDWAKQRDKYFQKAGREDTQDAGRVYDKLRQFYDNKDHPVAIGGVEFPSPVRVHFAMLPPDAQKQYTQNLMVKPWQYLSKFDKGLLGAKVDNTVQKGWTYYNDSIYEAIGGPKGTIHKAGIHPQLDADKKLAYAAYVDTQYPGFLEDYTRSLQPIYARMAAQKVGSTPSSRRTWGQFFGKVSQFADWAAGPIKSDPKYMGERDALFGKQLWTDLLQTGRQGVLNGTPLARVPDDEYPKGGYFYQWAMAQPDRTFQKEFKQLVIANPDFLYQLWANG